MKRALILVFILVCIQSHAIANIYIDGFGDMSYQGDAKTQYGGGLALGFDLTDDVKALYRFSYTTMAADSQNKTTFNTTLSQWVIGKKTENSCMMNMIGAEYVWTFMDQFGWRSSIMLGINSLSMGYYDATTATYPWKKVKDTGFSGAIFTGIQYTLSQHILPFIDLGYHYSYFSGELSNKTITGYTVLVGIRVAVFSYDPIGNGY